MVRFWACVCEGAWDVIRRILQQPHPPASTRAIATTVPAPAPPIWRAPRALRAPAVGAMAPMALMALAALMVLVEPAAGAPANKRRHDAPPASPTDTGAVAPGAAAAPEPWEAAPFTADPAVVAKAAARYAGRDGEPVVVLLSDQRYTLDDAGRETYTQRLVYRILTASADQSWSIVERSWSPWHQAHPDVRARVITPEGVAHLLDPSVLTESGEVQDAPDMFGDGRVLRGPLPATGPGVVVEQEVTVRDTAPFFDAGMVEIADLGASVPVHHAHVEIAAPVSLPLRWTARLLPNVRPRDETVAGPPAMRRLTFDYADLPANDDAEPGLPPEVPRSPYLAFATGRSWTDVARRYSEIVDQAIHGADLSALIRAAGGPAPSQLETMNRLLARLGDIRYTGVELGQGGIVPRSPTETLRRRFGDCKDKAVLLIAALRALDIPAYAALLNAGEDQQDVEPDLPGFGGFNHAIVVVPGSPSIWIDPTDRFARAGELPTDDQGRLALVASPTATGLVRTPESEATDNRAVKTREFFLADQGAARAVETDEYWGAAERDLRAFYTSEDADTVRESLSDYIRKTYQTKGLGAYDHANPLDLSHPFRLRLEAKDTRRAVTDEKGAAVAILPSALLDQLPDELTALERDRDKDDTAPRLGDYYFNRPFIAETIYRIVPPPGFAPRPLPPDRERRLGSATLSEAYAVGRDGVVTATLRLSTGKRRIDSAEFEQLRAGAQDLATAKPILVQFEQVGETDLAAGRVREAIAEFQREAAAAPRRALPHCRLARALLAGGLGEAARQEVERATRLEPRSAVAWRTKAWVLQHDAVGRRFGPGFDRAGAVAAYRTAKGLDPEDEATRADLGILLEHDDRGRRFGAGADLGAAIAELQALRTELKSQVVDDNLLLSLLHAGRLADLQTLGAELEDSPEREALRLTATAATAGAEAALGEAERRIADPQIQATALTAAAQELVTMRRYAEAAALLTRAAQRSPNPAAVLARAGALRRARRHEEAPIGAPAVTGPTTAARGFLLDALAEPPAADPMIALLSRGLREALSPAALRALAAAPGRGLRDTPGAADLPTDVRQDLALAAWHESARGDDALGYRIEIASTVGETPARAAIFVVPEGDAYRIAALGDLPATLGLEALRRLAAHDPRGAAQWLEWASAELRGAAPAPGDATAAPAAVLAEVAGSADIAAGAATPDELRCAAVSVAAPATAQMAGKQGESNLTLLRACRAAATGGANLLQRRAYDVALAEAYASLGRFPELLATAERLAAERPESDNAERPDSDSAERPESDNAQRPDSASAQRPESEGIALRTESKQATELPEFNSAQRPGSDQAAQRSRSKSSEHAESKQGAGRSDSKQSANSDLAAQRPQPQRDSASALAFSYQVRALAGMARWADLDKAAQLRLKDLPDDDAALRAASQAAARRGNLEAATALLRRVADGGHAGAADLNQLAWLALVRGRPDDQALEDAERAAALSGFRDAGVLHTLASLYAERGRSAEAYRVIVQSIDARPAAQPDAEPRPDEGDWYVFGHLAESYGLADEARRLYGRVRPAAHDESDPLSTNRLAQARLAALGTVKRAAAGADGRR